VAEENLKIDQVITTYLNVRTELDRKRKEYQVYEAEAKGQLDRLAMWLKQKGDELGSDSFGKPDVGTAFKTKKEFYRPKPGEWEAVIEWIKETGNYHVLEKRLLKTAIAEIVKETNQLPPGISYEQEITFQVRKPTKAKAS
jgi:hypothetical protein